MRIALRPGDTVFRPSSDLGGGRTMRSLVEAAETRRVPARGRGERRLGHGSCKGLDSGVLRTDAMERPRKTHDDAPLRARDRRSISATNSEPGA